MLLDLIKEIPKIVDLSGKPLLDQDPFLQQLYPALLDRLLGHASGSEIQPIVEDALEYVFSRFSHDLMNGMRNGLSQRECFLGVLKHTDSEFIAFAKVSEEFPATDPKFMPKDIHLAYVYYDKIVKRKHKELAVNITEMLIQIRTLFISEQLTGKEISKHFNTIFNLMYSYDLFYFKNLFLDLSQADDNVLVIDSSPQIQSPELTVDFLDDLAVMTDITKVEIYEKINELMISSKKFNLPNTEQIPLNIKSCVKMFCSKKIDSKLFEKIMNHEDWYARIKFIIEFEVRTTLKITDDIVRFVSVLEQDDFGSIEGSLSVDHVCSEDKALALIECIKIFLDDSMSQTEKSKNLDPYLRVLRLGTYREAAASVSELDVEPDDWYSTAFDPHYYDAEPTVNVKVDKVFIEEMIMLLGSEYDGTQESWGHFFGNDDFIDDFFHLVIREKVKRQDVYELLRKTFNDGLGHFQEMIEFMVILDSEKPPQTFRAIGGILNPILISDDDDDDKKKKPRTRNVTF